jgi:predicted permease
MTLLTRLRSWLRNALHRSHTERDMDAELRFHLNAYTEDLVRSGLPRREALRRARVEFGGMEQTKEQCRDARGLSVLESLLQDLRFGLRMLRKSPGFTTVAVLTLALGIGANTSIFSFVNAVLLSSIPVRDPQNLVLLKWFANNTPSGSYSSHGDCLTGSDGGRRTGCSLSYPMFKEIRSHRDLFAGVAATAGPYKLEISGNGEASVARGILVSGDYFQTLGVNPDLGRVMEPADELPGAEPVAVLSFSYWQSAFGGSSSAIGKYIRLNNFPVRIIGVANPQFTRLSPGKTCDLWLPLGALHGHAPWMRDIENPENWWLTVIARLNPNMSPGQAQQGASLLFRNTILHAGKPQWKDSDDPSLALLPAQKGLTGIRRQLAAPLYILMATVGIVLLIACTNVAGLMLARASGREKEMAVRSALGAGRARIIRQLLTESILLSVSGGVIGVLLAHWGTHSLAAFLYTNGFSPLSMDVSPDKRVLVFTASIAILTGVFFGLAPAVRGIRVDLAPALKSNASNLSSATRAGSHRFGFGSCLVVAQIGLSVVILMGAGLLVRTLANLQSINPGFDTQNLLQFGMDPTLLDYPKTKIQSLYSEMQSRLEALPGVLSVTFASDLLLNGGLWTSSIKIEGDSQPSSYDIDMLAVGPGFFETMRIPPVIGRTFSPVDFHSADDFVVVNQAFVRRYLPNRDPLAVRLRTGHDDKPDIRQIVGVVADTRYESLRNDVAPTAYIPQNEGAAYFELRTAANPDSLIAPVRLTVSQLDPDLPVFDLRTQRETVDRLLFNERLVARLSTFFAVLALILACIGLYGLLAYEVSRRTREIGIRTSLGAQPRDVLRLILGHGFILTILGIAIGAAAAFALMRYIRSLLYGVSTTDLVTFVAVSSLLLLIALLASYIPARRAMRVDPVIALRYE